jgi:hypothetical protein
MKNFLKTLGIIAFVVVLGLGAFTSCEKEDAYSVEPTNGRLTITGLTNYQNVYAASTTLFAAADIDAKEGTFTYGAVSGGSVTLQVWNVDSSYTNFTAYSGSASETLAVFNKVDQNTESTHIGYVTVTFANGIGTAAFAP